MGKYDADFIVEMPTDKTKQNNKITKKQNTGSHAHLLLLAKAMKMKLELMTLEFNETLSTPLKRDDMVIYKGQKATVKRVFKTPKASTFYKIEPYLCDIIKEDGKTAINMPHSSLQKIDDPKEEEQQKNNKPTAEKPQTTASKLENKGEREFVEFMQQQIIDKVPHNKLTVEKAAKKYGIESANDAKELTELAIVFVAKRLAENTNENLRTRFDKIVDLYHSQVNLSQRTSLSIIFQQYSTPCPISFLAGMWVMSKNKDAKYFEPSAGNGLLCHALPYSQLYVNELEDRRIMNLFAQPFSRITTQDAALPFSEYGKIFDGVLTNPPFGKLDIHTLIDGYVIKKLEHVMAINMLSHMKDNGRAAIIIGGHTEYDDATGVITNKGSRYFLNFLYHFYNVVDIIPIDGHQLYSRQGTAVNTRLILIDGRKSNPEGIAAYSKKGDTNKAYLRKVVDTFDSLFDRVIKNDIHHFSTMQDYQHDKRQGFEIKKGAKVSFLSTNYSTVDGVVDVESYAGSWTVRTKKHTIVVLESDLIPQIISVSLEKNGQGYKAFKNIKSEFDIKHFRVAFADKSDTVVSADDREDARYKAIKWKLQNK